MKRNIQIAFQNDQDAKNPSKRINLSTSSNDLNPVDFDLRERCLKICVEFIGPCKNESVSDKEKRRNNLSHLILSKQRVISAEKKT